MDRKHPKWRLVKLARRLQRLPHLQAALGYRLGKSPETLDARIVVAFLRHIVGIQTKPLTKDPNQAAWRQLVEWKSWKDAKAMTKAFVKAAKETRLVPYASWRHLYAAKWKDLHHTT